jgi:hypothetical protein
MADAQLRAGQRGAARATLERLLKSNPANAAALTLRDRLQ